MIDQSDMVGPFCFGDWPAAGVPAVAAGIYAIWDDVRLLYVRMSGRGRSRQDLADAEGSRRKVGLWTRLNSHASGRRSGDQFCVYVPDRPVLPTLTAGRIESIAAGATRMDDLVRAIVRDQMSCRFAITVNGRAPPRSTGSCAQERSE
ncbi:MAG: hypothetical protein ACI8Y4_005452, partial [Candidatus Poriferisodalaceae bacterium]